MRTTTFGDTIIESTEDDLSEVVELGLMGDEVHAVIRLDEEGSGKYDFEVVRNDDGESVVSSDPIFATRQDAATYLDGWVEEVMYGT